MNDAEIAEVGVMQTERDPKTLPGAAFMIQGDAILSRDVDQHIRKFLDAGGTEVEAFEMLSEKYDGVPDMIATITSWTAILEPKGKSMLEQALEDVLDENQATVVSRVDAAMLTVERPPAFLHELNESPRWAPVVAKIGRKHRNSALFNFLARSARLKQAGISHEVVSAPAPFLNALSDAVARLLKKKTLTTEDINKFFMHVRSLAAYDEGCVAIAGRLFAELGRLAQDPWTRGLYRRAAQEIRTEAVRAMQAVSNVQPGLALQFVQRLAIVLESVAANHPIEKQLLDALVAILSPERIASRNFDSECNILNKHYKGLLGETESEAVVIDGDKDAMDTEVTGFSQEEALKREVLVSMLCQSEVFHTLIESIFTQKKRAYKPHSNHVDENRRDTLCLLLSYAGVMVQTPHEEIVETLMDGARLKELRAETKRLRTRLLDVAVVCEDLKPGCPRFKFKGKPVRTLVEALDDPVISTGLLEWAREGLIGGEDERTLLVTTLKHLAFVEGIAEKHLPLRERALDILHEGFGRKYGPGLDVLDAEKLKDMYLSSMISFVPLFMGPAMVDMFLRSYASDYSVDETHLRRFVKGLLQLVGPPYGEQFANSVNALISHKRVSDACEKEAATMKLVYQFKKDAAGFMVPPLSSVNSQRGTAAIDVDNVGPVSHRSSGTSSAPVGGGADTGATQTSPATAVTQATAKSTASEKEGVIEIEPALN